MATVTLLPKAAADLICHDEQMTIWSGDFVGALSLSGFLRTDLEYHEVAELHEVVAREIRSVIEMALGHPEARTVVKV